MITIKKYEYFILPITICIVSLLVFLYAEAIISRWIGIATFTVSLLLSLYYIPYRVFKENKHEISKKISLFSNLINGVSFAYLALLIFIHTDTNIILFGKVFVISCYIFSYYLVVMDRSPYKKKAISHFIIAMIIHGVITMLS